MNAGLYNPPLQADPRRQRFRFGRASAYPALRTACSRQPRAVERPTVRHPPIVPLRVFIVFLLLSSGYAHAQDNACVEGWPQSPPFDSERPESLVGEFRTTIVLDSVDAAPVSGRLTLALSPPPEPVPEGYIRFGDGPIVGEISTHLIGLTNLGALEAELEALGSDAAQTFPFDSLRVVAPRDGLLPVRIVSYRPDEIAMDWKFGMDVGPSAYLTVERLSDEGFGGRYRVPGHGTDWYRGRFCAYRTE